MCWKLDLGFCEDTLSTLKQYGVILLDAKHKQILYCHRVINIAFVSKTWAFRYVSGQRTVQGQIRDTKDVDCVWNVMAHVQKPDFVFRRNGRVHLNRRGRQFSRLLAAEVCTSAVVMLDTPCSEVMWRVLATHSIRQFPLHLPPRASRCAIAFQLDSTPSLQRAFTSVSSASPCNTDWRFIYQHFNLQK